MRDACDTGDCILWRLPELHHICPTSTTPLVTLTCRSVVVCCVLVTHRPRQVSTHLRSAWGRPLVLAGLKTLPCIQWDAVVSAVASISVVLLLSVKMLCIVLCSTVMFLTYFFTLLTGIHLSHFSSVSASFFTRDWFCFHLHTVDYWFSWDFDLVRFKYCMMCVLLILHRVH